MTDMETLRDRPLELPLTAGPSSGEDRAAARLRDARRPDDRRSHLRDRLRDLDGAIASMRQVPTPASVDAVADAARELGVTLDLGAEPPLVACPICRRLGMVGATRCGFCWASLKPAT
jgi:hypothetical protein